MHWSCIKDLLETNDLVFFGDIKSHNIVKNKKNQNVLNRRLNNLKFYLFKQRLLYKSKIYGKQVFFIPEHYTTKMCSFCGKLNDPGRSKIYNCSSCKINVDRDINASKNILIKGILKSL